jgi:hypothetical protein
MLTSAQCLKVIGPPELEREMVVWDVPKVLEVGAVPNKIYCNRRMVQPLSDAFAKIKAHGLESQLKTWDGCFNIRKKRGGSSSSLHSWGLAIDINAAWNGFGKVPTMSKELVACFTEAGFDWGGTWSKPDGMHFQLRTL